MFSENQKVKLFSSTFEDTITTENVEFYLDWSSALK